MNQRIDAEFDITQHSWWKKHHKIFVRDFPIVKSSVKKHDTIYFTTEKLTLKGNDL